MYMKEKKIVPRRYNFVVFGDSIVNFSKYQKIFLINKLKIRVNDFVNCHGEIEQFINTIRSIEHTISKCRLYGLKTISLLDLTNKNALPRLLVKEINKSLQNIFNKISNHK